MLFGNWFFWLFRNVMATSIFLLFMKKLVLAIALGLGIVFVGNFRTDA